ncbi:MAG: hypothetical protein KatS3mg076_1168 [Candidatus Binatia bacterium]|nr:MAG: hypothetical protein KatS3mg076_1168 [Candidatus Binatia bacterium]
MSRVIDRELARMLADLERDNPDLDFELFHSAALAGGEPRQGQLTGTKALMLAVLEDGIRSYLSSSKAVSQEAEFWILSDRRRSPFSFVVVCEMLGLDPDAVRQALKRMKEQRVPPRKAIPRARPNVRVAGRVQVRDDE